MSELFNIKSMMLYIYWDLYVTELYSKNKESYYSFIIYINCSVYEFFFILRSSHVK